jgi:hypothetical protein
VKQSGEKGVGGPAGGSFLGVVASWGSTCDLIVLAVCFAVYVLLYIHFRQGHFTELLPSSENDLNNSQPLRLNRV